MALPILIVLVWRGESAGAMTRAWFHWKLKWEWIYSAVRDRWRLFDIATVATVPLWHLHPGEPPARLLA